VGPIASLELSEERNCLVPAGDWWAVRDHIKGNQSVRHIERLASCVNAIVRLVLPHGCIHFWYSHCSTGSAPLNYVESVHRPGTR